LPFTTDVATQKINTNSKYKDKDVGTIGCDCHDILSVCLAMTKIERIQHHAELTDIFYVISYNI